MLPKGSPQAVRMESSLASFWDAECSQTSKLSSSEYAEMFSLEIQEDPSINRDRRNRPEKKIPLSMITHMERAPLSTIMEWTLFTLLKHLDMCFHFQFLHVPEDGNAKLLAKKRVSALFFPLISPLFLPPVQLHVESMLHSSGEWESEFLALFVTYWLSVTNRFPVLCLTVPVQRWPWSFKREEASAPVAGHLTYS